MTSDATGRVGDKNSSWFCLLFVVLSRVSSLSMLTSACHFFLDFGWLLRTSKLKQATVCCPRLEVRGLSLGAFLGGCSCLFRRVEGMMATGWNTGAACRLLSAPHPPWVLWRGVFECHSVIAKQEKQQKTPNKQTLQSVSPFLPGPPLSKSLS